MFRSSLTLLVSPLRIFVPGRRCSDVRAWATSILFGSRIIKLLLLPPESHSGTSGLAIQGHPFYPSYYSLLIFSVIRPMHMFALPVKWANTSGYLLVIPLPIVIFLFNFYIQMFGHLLSSVTLAINTTLFFLMIIHTICGPFPFGRNLRYCPPLALLSPMFRISSGCLSWRYKLTMARNLIPMPYACYSQRTAFSCDCLAPTRRSKMGRQSACSVLLTIVLELCFFTVLRRRSSRQKR